MRLLAILAAAVILTGCDYGFTFQPENLTPDQLLDRAELVFIGVIQEQHIDSWPFFRLAGADHPELWKPVRRRVRVETVLRGQYSDQHIDVYEMLWNGAIPGNANLAGYDRREPRFLFLARKERGRWRSIRPGRFGAFPVVTGPHARLPLDDSRPFWERFALVNYWVDSERTGYFSMFERMSDPDKTIGPWRKAKLLRGLLRHPQRNVRLAACRELMLGRRDECARDLSEIDVAELADAGLSVQFVIRAKPPDSDWERDRFDRLIHGVTGTGADRDRVDELRLSTTIDQPVLRHEFCQKFLAKFPHDTDNGCSPNNPFPATIVTENGDVPLVGPWPN